MILFDNWTAARRAWKLSAEAYRDDSPLKRLKQNLRWALAAAARPDAALAWFAHLQTRDMAPFEAANPILSFKPMRVYLSTHWSLKRRTKVMRETYGFALWRGGATREALLHGSGAGVILARFPLSDLGEGQIALGFDNKLRKEGEFAVTFQVPERGGRICSLSFALEWQRNGLAMFIGCVQGIQDGEDGLMKALGKAMHGLRPKALVVFAAQEIGRSLGVRELFGAGNAIQVHRRKHLIHIAWVHELSFDYDAFWLELGAHPAFDGWFFLPRKARPRSRDEIKPNKRGQYAKRYAMQDLLSGQIRAAMARAQGFMESPGQPTP
jgi:hypothetical protein